MIKTGDHHSEETKDKLRAARARQLMAGRNPHQIVELARKHTVQALLILVKLMNGEGSPMPLVASDGTVLLDEQGRPRKVPTPVPPQVQLRAAEIVLERGYGKSPQAILVRSDGNVPGGIHAVPIMERIAMIAQARAEQGTTTDLEASEQDEPETTEVELVPTLPAATLSPAPATLNPQDVI